MHNLIIDTYNLDRVLLRGRRHDELDLLKLLIAGTVSQKQCFWENLRNKSCRQSYGDASHSCSDARPKNRKRQELNL